MSDNTEQQNEYPAIVVLNGEMKSHNWILEKEEMILGRDDTCDIVIPQRQISRQHVVFRRIDGTYHVQDLDSKNGTWVNGNRLEGDLIELADGDELHVALQVRIRFVGSGITAPVTGELPDVIPAVSGQGRMRLDVEARRVFIDGVELNPPLSLPQYRLLELLYLNQGRVCSRQEVVDAVWPDAMGEGVSEQAIDALVRRLRDRLNEQDEHQYVVTVRGHGFRIDNPN